MNPLFSRWVKQNWNESVNNNNFSPTIYSVRFNVISLKNKYNCKQFTKFLFFSCLNQSNFANIDFFIGSVVPLRDVEEKTFNVFSNLYSFTFSFLQYIFSTLSIITQFTKTKPCWSANIYCCWSFSLFRCFQLHHKY